MKRILIGTMSILMFGCASQTGWTPTVDTYEPAPPVQSRTAYPPPQQCQPGYDRGCNSQGYYPQQGYPQEQGYYPQNPSPNARLSQDMAECKQLASRSSGGTAYKTIEGGLVGGAIGAAGGAITGAFLGNAGQGAAIGAAAGGFTGGAYQGLSAEEAYKRAYSNCLRNRGHNVVQ